MKDTFEKNKYSKKGYISYQTRKVRKLMYNNEISLAKRIIYDLYQEYPDDFFVKSIIADIYMLEGNYEESIKYNEMIDLNYSFKQLTGLYLKTGKLEKLYDLYLKYYKETLDSQKFINSNGICKYSYYPLQAYLKKMYEDDFVLDNNSSYMINQIYNYSEEEALAHIIGRHSDKYLDYENNYLKNFKSSFNISEDEIKKLYYKVKNYIENNPDKLRMKNYASECCYFNLNNIGKDIDGDNINTFIVITFIGTTNILSMHPTRLNKLYTPIRLDEEYIAGKLKIKSQIDKFNERYGIK